ncbi:hypothetical protein [Coprothermobacter proteolyticus]|uniref:hypothetical protein n=1 Tax=Coprothermobacter proteolyticus TaxID=35786 RepID=UPI000D30CB9A|nr:hypothetical protein [Coprothermobacter proteolyticus]
MVSQVKAFILAVVFALGSFFGYATLGPFTDLESQKAFDSYQTLVEDTVREQLERISSFTGEHTVGHDSLVFKGVGYADTDFESYNMVLEMKGYVVAKYEIRLVDGNLMCTSTLSSYAAFFKAHDEIKMSSFSLAPAGENSSSCSLSTFNAARQNH